MCQRHTVCHRSCFHSQWLPCRSSLSGWRTHDRPSDHKLKFLLCKWRWSPHRWKLGSSFGSRNTAHLLLLCIEWTRICPIRTACKAGIGYSQWHFHWADCPGPLAECILQPAHTRHLRMSCTPRKSKPQNLGMSSRNPCGTW